MEASIPMDVIVASFILLPGFITLFVERAMTYQKAETGMWLIAKALSYSMVSYAAFSLTGLPLVSWLVENGQNGERIVRVNSPASVAALTGTAIALGVIIGGIKAADIIMKGLGKIGITQHTSRPNIWLDLHYDKRGSLVEVSLKDGRRIYGYPEYFADEYTEGPLLFITGASCVSGNSTVKIPNPGILINGCQVDTIHFYEENKSGQE